MNAVEIEYLYRDSANFKFRGVIHLHGSLNLADFRQTMIDGEYFVPDAVGWKNLRPDELSYADHSLHEIVKASVIAVEDTASLVDAKDVLDRFRRYYT